MIRLLDRAYYTAAYGTDRVGGTLRLTELLARRLPTRTVRRLADRADRREAAAAYTTETRRVGILRRMAVDVFDVRSDTTCVYYAELRRRSDDRNY